MRDARRRASICARPSGSCAARCIARCAPPRQRRSLSMPRAAGPHLTRRPDRHRHRPRRGAERRAERSRDDRDAHAPVSHLPGAAPPGDRARARRVRRRRRGARSRWSIRSAARAPSSSRRAPHGMRALGSRSQPARRAGRARQDLDRAAAPPQGAPRDRPRDRRRRRSPPARPRVAPAPSRAAAQARRASIRTRATAGSRVVRAARPPRARGPRRAASTSCAPTTPSSPTSSPRASRRSSTRSARGPRIPTPTWIDRNIAPRPGRPAVRAARRPPRRRPRRPRASVHARPPEIFELDARQLPEVVPDGTAAGIVTSPPYAGTYDYAEHQRLRFDFLGLRHRELDAGEIGSAPRVRGGPRRGAPRLAQALADSSPDRARPRARAAPPRSSSATRSPAAAHLRPRRFRDALTGDLVSKPGPRRSARCSAPTSDARSASARRPSTPSCYAARNARKFPPARQLVYEKAHGELKACFAISTAALRRPVRSSRAAATRQRRTRRS